MEKSFCTLQRVYEEIILFNGDNTYMLPLIGKDKLIREHSIHHLRIPARHASVQAIQKEQDLVVNPAYHSYWNLNRTFPSIGILLRKRCQFLVLNIFTLKCPDS